MLAPLRKLFLAYWNAARRLSRDYGMPLASAATFSGVLALFPFLIFVTALAGFLGGPEVAEEAAAALFDNLPHEVADTLAPEVRRVLGERRGGFLTFGILLTFLFSSMGVESLRTALNRAYGVVETRPWWWRAVQNCLFVVAAAFAMLVFGVAVLLVPMARDALVRLAPALATHVHLFAELRVAVGTVVLTALVFALHLWLPAGRRRLASIWPGVLQTLILWLFAGAVYSAYLARSTYYATTYAGLANIMIAMVFFYIVAVIFVFGAELNRAFLEERAKRLAREAEAAWEGRPLAPQADAASGGEPAREGRAARDSGATRDGGG